MDCGLGLRKVQGLFSKMTPEDVSANQSRRIRIERPEMDPGGKKETSAVGTGTATAVQPWPTAKSHRRAGKHGHGPRLAQPRAPGLAGGVGGLGQAKEVAGECCRGAGRHGRQPEILGASG